MGLTARPGYDAEWYKEKQNTFAATKLSACASDAPAEFFAEAFAVYYMNREKMPPNIEKMMEVVLKEWKKN